MIQKEPAVEDYNRITEDVQQAFMTGEVYEETLDPAYLEESVAAWERVLHNPAFRFAPEEFQLPVLANAGQAFVRRFQQTEMLVDLDRAIHLMRDAKKLASTDVSRLPIILNALGDILSMRYDYTRQVKDLEASIAYYRDAISYTSPDDPDLPVYLNNLGTALHHHYKRTETLASLEEAIKVLREALQKTSATSSEYATYANNLGNALYSRHIHLGETRDLQQALELHQRAVEETIPGSPSLPGYLSNLGNDISRRFEQTGEIKDLEEAIDTYRQAVSLASSDDPQRSYYLNNLAGCLGIYYDFTGKLEALEETIQLFQDLVQHTTHDDPDFPDYLANLAHSLHSHFEQLGQIQDLQKAITLCRDAITLHQNSPDPFALPDYLNLLGDMLLDAYEYEGLTEYMKEAIELHKAALERTSPDHPDYPRYLISLLAVFRSRYTRTGQLTDLLEAINLAEEGIDQVPEAYLVMHAMLRYNLGQLLLARYERTQQWEDLEQATKYFQYGVQNFPPGSLMQARSYNTLGNALRRQYLQTKQQINLENAIEALQTSIHLRPTDSPELVGAYNDLGNAMRDRSTSTSKVEDLQEAIKAFQKALQLLQNTFSINRPIILSNLGNALREYYLHLKQQETLQQAQAVLQQTREVCEEACQRGLQIIPEVALGTARFWGNSEADQGEWTEAAHAYTYALQALEQLYRVQLLQTDKEHRLSEVSGLYIRAAYTMARAGQIREAITTLEQGRAKRLSEALARDQAVLEDVQELHSDAYQHYRNATERLRQLEQAEREGRILNFSRQAQAVPKIQGTSITGEQIRKAHEDLEMAIMGIRHIPGRENFLTLPTFQDIIKAVLPGIPLVYLATTQRGSFALLVHGESESPEAIFVGTFTEDHLRGLLVKLGGEVFFEGYIPGQELGSPALLKRSLAEILPRIGTGLLGVVARRLSELGTTGIVLIPTGLLGILPLHAASYVSNDKETTLLEEFDVAYAPSARVLTAARQEAQKRKAASPHFVGVGNPRRTEVTSLPSAHVEVETIEQMLPVGSFDTLYEEQATVENVWKILPHATIAHFACHGNFEISEPLDSALLLSDANLTLRDLLNAQPAYLARLQMVALSACRTAFTDFQHLPDEVIGLQAGFLQAGIPSVIGTLWPVNDLSTALLMTRFYEFYLRGDAQTGLPPQPPARALRLAQHWLRKLTADDIDAYLENQPDRQVRPVEQDAITPNREHPYANPYYWAAFVYYGVL